MHPMAELAGCRGGSEGEEEFVGEGEAGGSDEGGVDGGAGGFGGRGEGGGLDRRAGCCCSHGVLGSDKVFEGECGSFEVSSRFLSGFGPSLVGDKESLEPNLQISRSGCDFLPTHLLRCLGGPHNTTMPRFVPRERKHKKIARNKSTSHSNSNTETLLPETSTERDARRGALQKELLTQQPESKVSSKKRKRLDKYVETKLKKEENAELVRKLEGQRVDTSLLRSSKKLGRVHESQRERLSRALQERQAGLGDGAVLLQARREVDDVRLESERESGEDRSDGGAGGDRGAVVAHEAKESQASFGGGLKRPLEVDEGGNPVIKKRKRRKVERAGVIGQGGTANEYHGHSVTVDETSPPSDGSDDDEWQGLSSTPSTPAGDEGSDDDSSSSTSTQQDNAPRVSAFKAWADNVRNASLGFTPSTTPTNDQSVRSNFKPRAPSPDSVAVELTKSMTDHNRLPDVPGTATTIPRAQDIQEARLQLPVVQEEQRIMETINSSPASVICGATGSGKTTQIPQMLFENGYASDIGSASTPNHGSEITTSSPSKGMIGVTQPRRVAATSVASRVQYELGSSYRKRVAHQVRYDTNVSKQTAIKFMTDGILLREIQTDFLLPKYGVIVLDEAHERSVNTDILIGMLARIVPLRLQLAKEQPEKYYPLKLVIMSATLSQGVDSFLRNEKLWRPLGGPPPVVSVEGRQFPVTVHFARRTRRDYVGDVVEKVARGHRKLPSGGMLVFLTGQQEIQTVMKRLQERIGSTTTASGTNRRDEDVDDEDGFGTKSARRQDFLEGEEEGIDSDSEAEVKIDDEAEEAEFSVLPDPDRPHANHNTHLKLYILPLYAALPQARQLKVFQPPPSGTRLIVLATNVAETSLTIPGIRYVIDCGRVKEKRYNTDTGVQTFEVNWISKASAEQRKGRAGRTGPGHVWRLYSSNVYEEFFVEETVPEILRTGLESVVLQLKAMDIEHVANFPFPTPPDAVALKKADELLKILGAVGDGGITDAGREIMKFPISPRFGRILLLAQRNGVEELAIALVAGLAVGEIFVPESHGQVVAAHERKRNVDSSDDSSDGDEGVDKAATNARHQAYTRAQATLSKWDDESDAIKLLTAVAVYADSASCRGSLADFCKDFWLREKAMAEVQLLRRQLHSIVQSSGVGNAHFEEIVLLPPAKEIQLLKQLVAAGFIDQVAIRSDKLPTSSNGSGLGRKPRRAIEVAYRTLLPSGEDVGASASSQEREMARSVFVHPSSVLARLSPREMPTLLVYSHLSRAPAPTPSSEPSGEGTSKVKEPRTRFHPLTPIAPTTLALLAEGTPLLHIGKPIGKIEELPRDAGGMQRRQCWVGIGIKVPAGSAAEWPLTQWKIVQRRSGRDWEIERVVAR